MNPSLHAWLPGLRASLLVALGTAACIPDYTDKDDDTGDGGDDTGVVDDCGDGLPVVEPGEVFDGNQPRVVACIAVSDDGTCPTADEAPRGVLLTHPDQEFCGYDVSVECGPITPSDGHCCYEVVVEGEWCEGRPFGVAGDRRRAAATDRAGWCAPVEVDASALRDTEVAALAAWWLETAADEHASVAAFARAAMQLMALGAPADLLLETTAAQADEVAHARLAYGVAGALLGRAVGPGALDVRGALDGRVDAASVLRDVLVGGAVGEAFAAARARAAAEAAVDPAVKALLLRIADEEARHAALAWKTARWLLETRPGLRAVAEAALATPPPEVSRALGDAPHGWGALDPDTVAAVHAATWRAVVQPCADALLGVARDASPRA